jgi:hypothetical protein
MTSFQDHAYDGVGHAPSSRSIVKRSSKKPQPQKVKKKISFVNTSIPQLTNGHYKSQFTPRALEAINEAIGEFLIQTTAD